MKRNMFISRDNSDHIFALAAGLTRHASTVIAYPTGGL